MKRKGRKHQPKVGTQPERDYALHAGRAGRGRRTSASTARARLFWIAVVLIVA